MKTKNAHTIFITGTNSGFGKATVEVFANAGWNVAATVRDLDQHRDLFANLPNVALFELDVTNYEAVEQVAQKAIQRFGTINAVVNNAGYCLMGPTETTTMRQIEEQFKTNVFGVFAVTKAFLPHFRKNMGGTFINIASASAQFNYPYIAAYGASKWAVRGLSESLGIELAAFNIEVKVIYPGLHATRIFTKLDLGTDSGDSALQHYKKQFDTFNSAQTALTNVTSPKSIAAEVYHAVSDRKGRLNIISGGDAKLYALLKKVLPERSFQKLQIRSLKKPLSKAEISFAKWIFGHQTQKLEVRLSKQERKSQ